MKLTLIFLLLAFGMIDAAEDTVAPVVIEVFSDFQCPYCKQFAPAVRDVEKKGIDGIRSKVEFHNFPLSFHPFAQLAAQAAVAAGEQGKFWEMHDALFANQTALGRENLLKYARDLKLDMSRFEKDLDSDHTKQLVAMDKALGDTRKVQGTPTYFIDGKEFSGTKSTAELTALVRADVGRRVALRELPETLMSKGPAGAPVTVEFFADLESPISRSANYVLEEAMAAHPDSVHLQFRNYPLAFHPQSGLAHDAALTAAREGRFWAMANYIFDHQESAREQDLIAYAGKLGMDAAKFAETLHSHRYSPRVEADLADGSQRGVRGSPVIFVNGKRIDGVPSLKELNSYIDSALSAKPTTEPTKPAGAQ